MNDDADDEDEDILPWFTVTARNPDHDDNPDETSRATPHDFLCEDIQLTVHYGDKGRVYRLTAFSDGTLCITGAYKSVVTVVRSTPNRIVLKG